MEGYKFSKAIEVRYADVDMMGHVNNAKFLTFMEHARSQYFVQSCNWDWMKKGMVLARAEIDYKKPILLPNRPVAWIRTVKIGQTSFTQQNLICEAGQPGIVYAEATTILVHVDYATGRPVPIPGLVKDTISKYENGLVH